MRREPLGDCAYCGDEATERDHVIPRSCGGVDDLSNWVPACQPCNGSKGQQTPQEWRPELFGDHPLTSPADLRERLLSRLGYYDWNSSRQRYRDDPAAMRDMLIDNEPRYGARRAEIRRFAQAGAFSDIPGSMNREQHNQLAAHIVRLKLGGEL